MTTNHAKQLQDPMADQNTDPEIGRLVLKGAKSTRIELKQPRFNLISEGESGGKDASQGRMELMEITNTANFNGRGQQQSQIGKKLFENAQLGK